jgi:outer membrane protein with beta-barrel domain
MNTYSKILTLFNFFIILILLPSTTSASELNSKIGLIWGTGDASTNLTEDKPDIAIQGGILYQYKIAEQSSIFSSYTQGSADYCYLTCFSQEQRDIDWSSLQVNFKRQFSMTKRWSPFVRAGINHYTAELTGYYSGDPIQRNDIKESGLSYIVAAGLEFEAANGFFIGFEAQHMPMDFVETNTYSLFLGFSL